MTLSRFIRPVLVSLASVVIAGCAGGDLVIPPGEPTEIEMIQGDDQEGTAGLALQRPVVVRMLDQAGVGVPNQVITWVVSAGGGRATPARSMTDEEGLASSTWILGPSPGPNTLQAVAPEVGAVTFRAMAADGDEDGEDGDEDGGEGGGDAAPSATHSTVAVTPETIAAGSGTATITVVVRDERGNPIEGTTVVLHATGEGNDLDQPSPTGPDGVATGNLSSTVPGTKVISVTVAGTIELAQTAQVTVTAPVLSMQLIEGDNQTAPAGADVPIRPAVRVSDMLGAPVAGIQVIFSVASGGGTVYGSTQTTNADGIARVGDWTLGSTPGPNTLEARAAAVGGGPVVFTAQGTRGGGVHHFVFRVPPRDVGVTEWFNLEVAMVDAAGNVVPISGIEIYVGLFREGPGAPVANSRLRGDRFRDTEEGIAVFNLAIDKKGRYRFRALSDELPSLGPHGPEPWLYSNWFDVK